MFSVLLKNTEQRTKESCSLVTKMQPTDRDVILNFSILDLEFSCRFRHEGQILSEQSSKVVWSTIRYIKRNLARCLSS